jgi:hypothetical protein
MYFSFAAKVKKIQIGNAPTSTWGKSRMSMKRRKNPKSGKNQIFLTFERSRNLLESEEDGGYWSAGWRNLRARYGNELVAPLERTKFGLVDRNEKISSEFLREWRKYENDACIWHMISSKKGIEKKRSIERAGAFLDADSKEDDQRDDNNFEGFDND